MIFNDIKLETVKNIRDLAGYTNKDGLVIKKNSLIRGANLNGVCQNDMQVLYCQYNVRNVIDLRTPLETYEHPDAQYGDMEIIYNPVQIGKTTGVTQDEKSRKKAEFLSKLENSYKENPLLAKQHMIRYYSNLIEDEYSDKQYGNFLKLLVNVEGGTLWHCHLGKDRCGVATALLLEAMDFDRELIIEDYLHSNIGTFGSQDYPFSVEGFFSYSHREYIEGFYSAIDSRYGGLEKFWKLMDVTEEDKNRLKEKYLEK